MTDKWLRKTAGKEAAVRMLTELTASNSSSRTSRSSLDRDVNKADASTGTTARGKAISPYDDLVIDGDYIKQAAQAGQMKQILYAVAIRTP